ncbi:predicted protein [Postia placenta Mad-698-R]|nr:predicted protein [Postia placenta Mad-698-R]
MAGNKNNRTRPPNTRSRTATVAASFLAAVDASRQAGPSRLAAPPHASPGASTRAGPSQARSPTVDLLFPSAIPLDSLPRIPRRTGVAATHQVAIDLDAPLYPGITTNASPWQMRLRRRTPAPVARPSGAPLGTAPRAPTLRRAPLSALPTPQPTAATQRGKKRHREDDEAAQDPGEAGAAGDRPPSKRTRTPVGGVPQRVTRSRARLAEVHLGDENVPPPPAAQALRRGGEHEVENDTEEEEEEDEEMLDAQDEDYEAEQGHVHHRGHSSTKKPPRRAVQPPPIFLPEDSAPQVPYPCGIPGCNRDIGLNKSDVTTHMDTFHEGLSSRACPWPGCKKRNCGKNPEEALARHVLAEHGPLTFWRCPKCSDKSKPQQRKDSFQRHIKSCRGQKCRAKGRSKKAQKQDTRKPTAASQVEVVPQGEVPDVGTSIAVAASQGADVTSTPAASVGEDSTEGFDEESEQMLDTPWHYPIDADDIIWDQIAGLPRASSPHDSAGDVGGSEATLSDHPEVMDFVEDNLNFFRSSARLSGGATPMFAVFASLPWIHPPTTRGSALPVHGARVLELPLEDPSSNKTLLAMETPITLSMILNFPPLWSSGSILPLLTRQNRLLGFIPYYPLLNSHNEMGATQSVSSPSEIPTMPLEHDSHWASYPRLEGVDYPGEEPLSLPLKEGAGYPPYTLGQFLQAHQGRYQIIRKLGWGDYASVWLARSERLWEREVLRSIANADPTHPGYKYCTPLRELFLTNTVHGTHVNFVTGVLGPNLNQLYHRFPRGPARTVVAKRITKQVLLALSYLHGPCQSIHTGFVPDLEGGSTVTPVKTQTLPPVGLEEDISNIKVCLADYGHAAQPELLRAPEIVLEHKTPWSYPIDIWSLGCLIPDTLRTAEERERKYVEQMVIFLGREAFSEAFLKDCARRDDFFDKDGNLLTGDAEYRPAEVCLETYKDRFDASDLQAAAAFIRRCMAIDPSARPSAEDLLQDDCLKDLDI